MTMAARSARPIRLPASGTTATTRRRCLGSSSRCRRAALERFGLTSLPNGQPLSLLEARLVPLYLHHRFQLQAALKWIGGLYFTYAVKEQGKAGTDGCPARRARRRSAAGADRRVGHPGSRRADAAATDPGSDSSAGVRLHVRNRRTVSARDVARVRSCLCRASLRRIWRYPVCCSRRGRRAWSAFTPSGQPIPASRKS